MKKLLLICCMLVFLSSCAYNSANLMAFIGRDMDFSYGLISIKNVDRVILLRETNSGDGEVAYNIPDVSKCIPYYTPEGEDLRPTEDPVIPDIAIPNEIIPKESRSIYPRDK